MALEEHVIDIVVRTKDQVSAGLAKSEASLRRFDQSVQRTAAKLAKMASEEYRVTLRAIDQLSPTLGRAARSLTGFVGRTYSATLGLRSTVSAGITTARAQLAALTNKAWNITLGVKNYAAGKVDGLFQSLTGFTGQMAAGAGIGYGIYDTVKTYMEFQKQMSAVGAVSGASASDMQLLSEKAKEMGATTVFSSTEAGKAMEYMAQAGWKTQDMMNGISGVINLAAASGEDLGQVASIVTSAISAFGLQASDSAHFADVLAAAANGSNTNVGALGYSFEQVASTAGTLGYSIEDVSLALGLLANNGLRGEKGGTSLSAMLNGMINPSKTATETLNRLGVSMFDTATGKARPLRDVLKDLRAGFAGLTQEEKAQAAYDIAGIDGGKALQILTNASEDSFNQLADAIDHADGAAKKAADTRLDNLSGDLTALSDAWEAIQLTIMDSTGAAGGFRSLIQGLTGEFGKIKGYVEDGLDFGDIFRIAGDLVIGLKNKFLEFDGVGSILAGGALVGGLMKIISLAQKAKGTLGEFAKGNFGGGDKGGDATTATTQSMIVNANSVVINDKGGAAADAASGADVPDGGKGSTKMSRGARMKAGMKSFGKSALPLMLAFGAYDAYSTSEENAQALQEAEATGDADYIAKTKEYNTNRMGGSIGSTAGSVAGGLLGAAVGSLFGPGVGTMAGGLIGSALGGAAGEFIGSNASGIGDFISNNAEYVGNGIANNAAYVGNGIANNAEYVANGISNNAEWIANGVSDAFSAAGDFMQPFIEGAEDGINIIVGLLATLGEFFMELFQPLVDVATEAWNAIVESASALFDGLVEIFTPLVDTATEMWASIVESATALWDGLVELFGSLADWFIESVWAPISDYASSAWAAISAIVSAAWDWILSVWSAAVEWFNSAWAAISAGADSVYTAITSAFSSAWETVVGIWNKATSWFESNVINPVRDKFNSLRELGSFITGLGGSGGKEKDANGTLAFSPRHAIIGEAGPEAVIPLGASRRNRAIDLVQKVASYLGMDGSEGSSASLGDIMNAQDDVFGGADEDDSSTFAPLAAPVASQEASGGQGGITVQLGGVNVSFTLSADSGTDSQAIIQAIRDNLENLSDEIGGKIAEKVGAIAGNQPVMA